LGTFFSGFGIMLQEKSGNPAYDREFQRQRFKNLQRNK
jgi:hypothetical protein